MKYKTNILVALLLGFTLFGCKKQGQVPIAPKIANDKVEITAISATFTWTVEWSGKLASIVEVSEHNDMSNSCFYGSDTETESHNFTVIVADLNANTQYYYRFWVWNRNYIDNKFVFEEKSMLTLIDFPKVRINDVTDVNRTSAKVLGEVTDEGGSAVTERGICWSTSHNPNINDSHLYNGNGLGMYSIDLTDLIIGCTYYVRAYATNSKGTAYGEEICFSTEQGPPVVSTNPVTRVTWTTATGGGEVLSDGGNWVTERGICWSTNPNPTIYDYLYSNGSGIGSYLVNMSDLEENTTYYVRSYAINDIGISYGDTECFTTLSTPPTGAIKGLFTVSNGKQVYFSQGNLQYHASSNIWKFAEKQYDYVGMDNNNISYNYNGWIDLFGWGTGMRPFETSLFNTNYGNGDNDITGSVLDWSSHAIINGGNQEYLWRTPTRKEWVYILNGRSTASGIRYAKACVNDINGVILLPDNWLTSVFSLHSTNQTTADYSVNNISASQWVVLEQHGAVFLPAAGSRAGNATGGIGDYGNYWTITKTGSEKANCFFFSNTGLGASSTGSDRFIGRSVRLIYDAPQ